MDETALQEVAEKLGKYSNAIYALVDCGKLKEANALIEDLSNDLK